MTATIQELLRPVADELARVEEIIRGCLSSAEERIGELDRRSLEGGAKRIRPALTLFAGAACGEIRDAHLSLAAAAELIHMATLAHDDVIDAAAVRRGRATHNASWGNSVAVLYGDYLLTRAFELLAGGDGAGLLPAMVRTTREVCEGELYQLRRRFDISMTEAEYREMASKKTASLFAACCRQGAALAGAHSPIVERLERFGRGFGIAFQIADDCADIAGTGNDKDRLKDLEGGRVTIPLIKALASLTGGERNHLARAFREGNVASCRREIILSGAVEACMRDAAATLESAAFELSPLPNSPARSALRGVARFVAARARVCLGAG
jgi:octaprenyl-diphosphate synthase